MPAESKRIDALIRHEALNVMANLRFLAESGELCDPAAKQDVLDSIAWMSILVGQPDVFLGKSQHFLTQTSLQEVLEIATLLQGLERREKIEWQTSEECFILTDKNRAKDLFAALFRFLLDRSEHLELQVQKNVLWVGHHQGLLSLPSKTPLECLNAAKLSNFDRVFCTLLGQASGINLNVRSKEDAIEVEFTPVKG